MRQAQALTPFGAVGCSGRLGLNLRSKLATLLAHESRSLVEAAKGEHPNGASRKVGSAGPAAIAGREREPLPVQPEFFSEEGECPPGQKRFRPEGGECTPSQQGIAAETGESPLGQPEITAERGECTLSQQEIAVETRYLPLSQQGILVETGQSPPDQPEFFSGWGDLPLVRKEYGFQNGGAPFPQKSLWNRGIELARPCLKTLAPRCSGRHRQNTLKREQRAPSLPSKLTSSGVLKHGLGGGAAARKVELAGFFQKSSPLIPTHPLWRKEAIRTAPSACLRGGFLPDEKPHDLPPSLPF